MFMIISIPCLYPYVILWMQEIQEKGWQPHETLFILWECNGIFMGLYKHINVALYQNIIS